MSTLAFFPWLKIDSPLQVAEFILIPYTRGTLPDGFSAEDFPQETIDAILEPYIERGSTPVRRATLLQLDGEKITSDLDEGGFAIAFLFSELLALAGLSQRQYFDHFSYCNRDIFRIVVQRFEATDGMVTLTCRRRDGGTANIIDRRAFRVHRPYYVAHPFVPVQLDLSLLGGCLRARGESVGEIWNQLYESIVGFNLANTDSDYVAVQSEVVLLVGAFERLLGCTRGKADDLVEKLLHALPVGQDLHVHDCERLAKGADQKRLDKCVREAWIRDFYGLRSDLAHGRREPAHALAWNLHDHLLLGSFLFPLALKTKLGEVGCYDWTPEDQFHADVFERLACEEHCIPYRPGDEPETYPWNRIMGEARFDMINSAWRRRAAERWSELSGDES